MVSALIATISFAAVLQPVIVPSSNEIVSHFYATFFGLSGVFCLLSVMICTILYSSLNQLPTHESIRWFLDEYSYFLHGPITFFCAGGLLLIAGLVTGTYMIYGAPSCWIIAGGAGGGAFISLASYGLMQRRNMVKIRKIYTDATENTANEPD